MFSPGDEVSIAYTGYETHAVVIHHDTDTGWVTVRELGEHYGDEGPVYDAAEEYVRLYGTERTCREPFDFYGKGRVNG